MKLYLVAIDKDSVPCYELCDFRDLIAGVFSSKEEAAQHVKGAPPAEIDKAIYELELDVPVKTAMVYAYENIKQLGAEGEECK